jgi:uncharacterized protein YgiM (DUF1202 family)
MMRLMTAAILAAGALATTAAVAAPGDTYRVTGERVNLRAGPSDSANVRGQVLSGEQLLELRRDGSWYGVRVLRTGEEGWIFGDLIEPTATSTLAGGEGGVAGAGFGDLSRDFDRLLGSLTQRYGFALFDRVSPAGGDTLEVTMSEDWLRAGSQDEHLLAAAAIYQMWKNHQNSAPVRVVMLDPRGERYVTIDETQGPALLTVAAD